MSVSDPSAGSFCAACGARVPAAARFCPGCGAPVDEADDLGTTARAGLPSDEQVPPDETGPVPVAFRRAETRWFGLAPALLLLLLALVTLAAAVALFVTGHWPVGLILCGVAILFFTGFLETGRRKPDTAVARASVERVDDARARAGSAFDSLAARGRQGRETLRLRQAVARLHGRRRDLLTAFGDAVYRDEPAAADGLRGELQRLDAELGELERQLRELPAATRERIAQARLAVQSTQMVSVPEPYPPPDEGTPASPAIVPEPAPPPDEGTPPTPDPVPTPGPEPTPGPPAPER